MKRAVGAALIGVLLAAGSAFAATLPARHKPGPVTIRGVAEKVTTGRFILYTSHHGTYTVQMLTATTVDEKGRKGPVHLQGGDHVGVRGFVSGRSIRAIRVRIYPSKPKQESLRGTIVARAGNTITLRAGSRSIQVRLTPATTILGAHGSLSVSALGTGTRVDVRVVETSPPQALHIHVYAAAVPQRHVVVRGRVVSIAGTAVTLAAGTQRVAVRTQPGTRYYLGSKRTVSHALRTGQSVTVYACCAGSALAAASIHIKAGSTHTVSTLVHGRVIGVSGAALRLTVAGRTVTVQVAGNARVTIGSRKARLSEIRPGDAVTVRVTRGGSQLHATSVHVLASSRQPRSLSGHVVSISAGTVVLVETSGARVLVRPAAGARVTLNHRAARWSDLKPGDRVRMHALPGGGTLWLASTVTASRSVPKVHARTLTGTILAVSRGAVTISVAGRRYTVRLRAGGHVSLGGARATTAALFPGVSARVHGVITGGTIQATRITVSLKQMTVHGQVVRAGGGVLVVRTTAGSILRVTLPTGLAAIDGLRRVPAGTLQAGALVIVHVYLVPGGSRAIEVAVDHPTVDHAGTLAGSAAALTLRLSTGATYPLVLTSSTAVTLSPSGLPLARNLLQAGMRVHVVGTVDSRGRLAVSSMTVRLHAATVRGQIASTRAKQWTVLAPSGSQTVSFLAGMTVSQGAHVLALGDVVVGDDVTVYGYQVTATLVLARRIAVHRRLVGVDGVITMATSSSLVLHGGAADYTVLLSPATVLSGDGTVAVGTRVHVTGYRRGDGVILATRLHLLPPAKAPPFRERQTPAARRAPFLPGWQ